MANFSKAFPHLTDIPRQGEEYEVPYHINSSSWSGISVLLHTKFTVLSGV